jgi:hypothetical protein
MVELDYYNPEMEEDGNLDQAEGIIIAHMNSTGRLLSLSLCNEEAVFWMVLRVEKEEDIIEILNSIPLEYELNYEFFQLDHYEVIQEIGSFSLN